MRLLLINTIYGFGSTGKICAEIAKETTNSGNTCMVACRESRASEGDQTKVCIVGGKADTRIHGALSRAFDDTGLHSIAATRKFIRIADEYNPDVLWLHNLHGYYINYEILFEWIKNRPGMLVKWTLHDCWAFTGHCSYFTMVGCEKWKTGCHHCPQLKEYPKSIIYDNSRNNYLRKRNAFCGVKGLEIITPSKWLADLVKQSFLSEYQITVVHNTINLDIFKPSDGDFKKIYQLEKYRIVLGVANIWGKRKGLDRFIEIAKRLPNCYKVVLVGKMTKAQKQALPSNVLSIDRTNNAMELADIYSSADVLLLLTREDNYPTVSIEAEACGTRVITLKVGGCPETITRPDSIAVESLDEVYEQIVNVN